MESWRFAPALGQMSHPSVDLDNPVCGLGMGTQAGVDSPEIRHLGEQNEEKDSIEPLSEVEAHGSHGYRDNGSRDFVTGDWIRGLA